MNIVNILLALVVMESKKHKDPLSVYKSIHQRAKNGDTKCVELMVKEGASVNKLDNSIHKFTPLHWACQTGALECVHWLLWHGADSSVSSTKGWTPLHVAAIMGKDACIQALINNGVDVNARDLHGNSAAHMAATHGHTTALSTLLRAGIDANRKNKRGWTPTHCSSFHGRLGCLQTLLKWGGRPDEVDRAGNNAVHLAASTGHLSCFKFLMGENSAPSSSDWLSERNNDGETPKMMAQRCYKQDVVDYIEHVTWERDHPEEAESLAFPAHRAAYAGDLNQLKLLLENDVVNINERDGAGSTPAHKAAGQGNLEIVQWLIDFGADLDLKNRAGETPKDVARRFSRLSVVKLLGGGEEGDDGEDVTDDSIASNREDARGNALKVLKESQRRLEVAKLNYVQMGGSVDDVVTNDDRDAMASQLDDLRQRLEAEKRTREYLEDTMEEYKEEILRLTFELQQIMTEKEKTIDRKVVRKKSSKDGRMMRFK